MRVRIQQGFIKCNVGKKMFEGERVVAIPVYGKSISAIVDENRISGEKLKVDICGFDKKENRFLIRIPGESFTTSKIWVPKDSLNDTK